MSLLRCKNPSVIKLNPVPRWNRSIRFENKLLEKSVRLILRFQSLKCFKHTFVSGDMFFSRAIVAVAMGVKRLAGSSKIIAEEAWIVK